MWQWRQAVICYRAELHSLKTIRSSWSMYLNERLHGGCQCATSPLAQNPGFSVYVKKKKRLENMKNVVSDSDAYMTSFCATTSYKTAGHKQKTQ